MVIRAGPFIRINTVFVAVSQNSKQIRKMTANNNCVWYHCLNGIDFLKPCKLQ